MNSAGEVVGNGLTLNLSATRDNAGIYTCTVPDVPLILPVMFEVVIYRKRLLGMCYNATPCPI